MDTLEYCGRREVIADDVIGGKVTGWSPVDPDCDCLACLIRDRQDLEGPPA